MIGAAVTAVLIALPASGSQERLEHWPQWRGPNGDGTAPQGDPPVEWSETKNVRWKVEVPGSGSSTPIVWRDRIYLLSAADTGRKPGDAATPPAPPPARPGGRGMSTPPPTTLYRFDVLCFDRMTGKELWRRTAVEEKPHEGHHPSHGYASASPSTDGKLLIAPFGSRGVFCYDLDGNLKWKADLGDMRIKVGFGEGASPALHAGSVIVNWDHEAGSFIACLEAATGREKWRASRDEATSWTTPFVVEHGGVTQVVVNAFKRTRSYDLATGKLIWECGGQAQNPIPTPVARDGIVYCMTGFRGFALYAIRLDSKGDVSGSAQVAWKRTEGAPYVASPVLVDDLLYFTQERQGIVSCVDARTGEVRFGPERLPGIETIYASLAGAAGRIYVVGRNGTTCVLRHGPKFELLAKNVLDEGVDASPVIVGRQLYLRGAKHLYCLEARDKANR
jgi:outer membrane protein assembly factor BamB